MLKVSYLVAVAALVTVVQTASGTTLYSNDFSDPVGTDPAGWSGHTFAFGVNAGQEYEGTHTSGASMSYNVGDTNWTDYQVDLKLRFSATGSPANTWVGVGGRHVGGTAAYYHFGLRLDGYAEIKKFRSSGSHTLLDSASGLSLSQNTDYLLRYIFNGHDITAMLTTTADTEFLAPIVSLSATYGANPGEDSNDYGGLALRMVPSGGSVTMVVDDLVVTEIPEPGSLGLLGLSALALIGRRRR